ncbi:MAG: amidohydrolase family protein [Gemmatimonadota bacterium]
MRLIAFVLLLTAPLAAQAPTPPQITALRAARMLDVRSGAIVANPVVLISGERITDVGGALPIPAGAKVIDLGNVTLMPGLIDVHTHLLQNYDGKLDGDDPNMLLTVASIGNTRRALLGAAMGREDLEAGITTVRDLGNSGLGGDVALRDAIGAGWVTGPRIVASTRALSAAGGQFGQVAPEAQSLIANEYAVISGVEDARRAVRQALYDGADVIKVIVNTGPRVVALEELKVIVDEAAREGRKVAAHAIGAQATAIAAQAGVASIEHAYTIPDSVLQMMKEKGIFLVPTDYMPDFYLNVGSPAATPAEQKQREAGVKGFTSGSRERLRRAMKMGVRVAFGSDEYYQMPGFTRGEATLRSLRAYSDAGLTPIQVIRAATVDAADLLGWSGRVGALERLKYADIIAVPGNPLEDILALEKVSFVMKGGKVVKQ